MTVKELRHTIGSAKYKSAWARGVALYAWDILDYMDDDDYIIYDNPATRKELLNGAQDWAQYSYGGCSLIYDDDIAERLCNPTELKRTKNGKLEPNKRETWLDTQARALYQAEMLIFETAGKATA